jgi:hypothetical protein
MGFFKENKHANGTTSTDWGGSIAGGFGGAGGIAIAFMVFAGAVVAGGFALLWFAIMGYKKFNLGGLSRVFALVLSIVYGYIVYTTFASGKPDLMILVYANIPVAIFFIAVYILSKRDNKHVIGTSDNLGTNRKSTSIMLALVTGGIGFNNFYNKQYIVGIVKFLLFSFTIFIIMSVGNMNSRGTTLVTTVITVLFIIGWIEAFKYFKRPAESFLLNKDK